MSSYTTPHIEIVALVMAFRIKIAGVEVVCETADEVIALTGKMVAQRTSAQAPATARQVHHRNEPIATIPAAGSSINSKFDIKAQVRSFLIAIKEAGANGAAGDVLTSRLGLRHPKALGGRLALINEQIRKDGFLVDEIYKMNRTDKRRHWLSSSRTNEYLNFLDDL